MIVKIDVQDNDFTEMIDRVLNLKVQFPTDIFGEVFEKKMKELAEKDTPESYEEYRRVSIQRDTMRDLLSKDNSLKPEEKADLSYAIKKGILSLIKNKIDKEDYEYLEDEIEVSIVNSMSAKWENGEVIYFFPNTYSESKFLLF